MARELGNLQALALAILTAEILARLENNPSEVECLASDLVELRTALIEGLVSGLCAEGVKVLRVTTTNDNLEALRFYQRRGFRIIALYPGAVDESRRIKPSISAIGEYGIPIHDEIELERAIGTG
jgi:hypothetical protein